MRAHKQTQRRNRRKQPTLCQRCHACVSVYARAWALHCHGRTHASACLCACVSAGVCVCVCVFVCVCIRLQSHGTLQCVVCVCACAYVSHTHMGPLSALLKNRMTGGMSSRHAISVAMNVYNRKRRKYCTHTQRHTNTRISTHTHTGARKLVQPCYVQTGDHSRTQNKSCYEFARCECSLSGIPYLVVH